MNENKQGKVTNLEACKNSEKLCTVIFNKNTLEYMYTWEKINNPHFNYPEFGVIENVGYKKLRQMNSPH